MAEENKGSQGSLPRAKQDPKVWGKENYPFPKGDAYIECDEMKCVGCTICQMACSMKHFGVINKDMARIQVRKYLLPLPKGIPLTCVQCQDEERECEKACPLDPPAMHYDHETKHMLVDAERCLGENCLQCKDACPAGAIRSYPAATTTPLVCDLCDTENNGQRDPQCVNVCPYSALRFLATRDRRFEYSTQDFLRKTSDEKADLIATRLYPLTKDVMANPNWSDKK